MPDKAISGSKGVSLADDPVLNDAVNKLRRMRYFRRQYDQRRILFYRQYLGQRDARMFPDNVTSRSNTFVPYPLSNVESIVSRVDDAFFSFDPWFETKPRGEADQIAAENMECVLADRLHKANFKAAFETLVRNICIYGHAAIKVDWDWDTERVTYAQPIYAIDPNTGQPLMQQVQTPMGPMAQPIQLGVQPMTKDIPRSRPKFIPIDVFDILVDPDGGIVAHFIERTLGQMHKEAEQNQKLYFPEALEKLTQRVYQANVKNPEQVIIRLAEVWDEFTKTQTLLVYSEEVDEALKWKDLRYSYRSASYSPYKREAYGGEPILLYHGPNPFMHQRNPILHTSFIKLPNEVYGLGAVEIISELTEALNKMVNMVVDNWNLGINHRYAYDTAADIDHEALNNFNTPGGKVAVSGDPSKVIMPLPFFTPQAGDYQILDLFRGQVELASGVSDFYSKGVGSPTNNKTASGISNVMNESNYRFKLFIRNLELDILQPMLEMCASMVQQFIQDPIEIQITGQPPAIRKWAVLTPEELIGTLDFQLVAANYATNKIIRQRQFMALMNIAAQSPFLNQYEVLKEAFKLFEIPNSAKLLYNEQQVAMMQQQQLDQQVKMMMMEAALQTEGKARLAQAKPQPAGAGKKPGQKPKAQFEGKIPGAGLTSTIRSLGQSMGMNSMGLEGLSEEGGF